MWRWYRKNAPKIWPVVRDIMESGLTFSTKCHCRQTSPRYRVEQIDQLLTPGDTHTGHKQHTNIGVCSNFINLHEVSNERYNTTILLLLTLPRFLPITKVTCLIQHMLYFGEWVTVSVLTIGPLPQPCAVQACSRSTCRLQGSSPSTTKKRWLELEFKICTPSSHRPKLVITPVTRTHSVMEYEIKKGNKNDRSNLVSGNCADRSFQGSEQIQFCTHCRKKKDLCECIIPLSCKHNHSLCTFKHNLAVQNVSKWQ